MRHLHHLSILHENQLNLEREIAESHAKNENFDPKNISGNIELGDTQDDNF